MTDERGNQEAERDAEAVAVPDEQAPHQPISAGNAGENTPGTSCPPKPGQFGSCPPRKSRWEKASQIATTVGFPLAAIAVTFNGCQIYNNNANNQAQVAAQLITGSTAPYQSMMQNPAEFAPLFKIPQEDVRRAVAVREMLSYYNAIFYYSNRGFIKSDLIDSTGIQLCEFVQNDQVKP